MPHRCPWASWLPSDPMTALRPILVLGTSAVLVSLLALPGCAGRMAAGRIAQRVAKGNQSDPAAAEYRTLMDAHNAFYAAINQVCAGDAAPMAAVWSHENDVSDFGPDGQMHLGWNAVDAQFRKEAAMKLGGTVACEGLRVVEGSDYGVTTCTEVGRGMMIDGKPAELRFRSTNVFRKEGDCWRMVHHHTDRSAPMEAKR
ncbi:MAG: nuclear transport factor 2 family protein [Planctomycetes bacterium]|nr:nuclear transport factor 2 family protein [Planctomycetota bacterium]